MSVDVTVLYLAGCASWQTALSRVHAAAKQAGVPVSVSILAVETNEDADRHGFTGSPTIRLDGADPFAQSDPVPALACRVFATADGLAGSPSVDQLVHALHAAARLNRSPDLSTPRSRGQHRPRRRRRPRAADARTSRAGLT